jgi:hypothetical protein
MNWKNTITIGKETYEITEEHNHDGVHYITLDDGTEWVKFWSSYEAGEEARKYWVDMARHDEKEFACIIGEKNLFAWELGEWAGPGKTKVTSLEDWFELWCDSPEEHWASYDGIEEDATISLDGSDPIDCVLYRTN